MVFIVSIPDLCPLSYFGNAFTKFYRRLSESSLKTIFGRKLFCNREYQGQYFIVIGKHSFPNKFKKINNRLKRNGFIMYIM